MSAAGNTPIDIVLALRQAYGWKLLGMLAFAQWILKGMVWGYALTGMEFLLREFAVSGPKMQVYKAVSMLPWAMKPMFGLLSDACPILGYRKAPYIVIVTMLAVTAHATIGFSPEGFLQVRVIVCCLVFGCMQISVVDLLTEARYAEKIREVPERGPDLMTFVWGGITVGNLVATGTVGFVLEHFGARMVYALIAAPAALVLAPTCLNWLEEEHLSPDEISKRRAKLVSGEQRELLVLVLLVGCSSLLLVAVGLLQDSVWLNLKISLVASVLVVGSFLLLLRPVIGLMNCFFFVQTCCALDVSGASFYFFTDDAEQYPEGPHFSKLWFASGLGVCVALLNLLGMATYNRYMQHWKYHGLFIWANLLLCAISLASCIVFLRWNVAWGVSDSLFVLGTWGAHGVVHMWMWLPGIVLLSHLCPAGVEATMYALLAGCHNLGLSVASYAGAALLQSLGISPRGDPNEGHQFDRLWIAALISSILPVLTLTLLPWMIPNASQKESLLDQGATATAGSPLNQLRAFWRGTSCTVDEVEDSDAVRFSTTSTISTSSSSGAGGYGATKRNEAEAEAGGAA